MAHITGEDSHEIRRRGFVLTGPEDSSSDLDPECMLDLIDRLETGTADRNEIAFGRREPLRHYRVPSVASSRTRITTA